MPSAPLGIVASHDHFKEATGGTITYSGGYTIHTFNSSGTFTIGAKGKRVIEWEVIGAGGCGASSGPAGKITPANVGGGGGAGGRITDSATLSPFYNGSGVVTAIPVTVGAGTAPYSIDGNPSSFLRQGGNETTVPVWNSKKTGANGGGPGWYLGPSSPGNTWMTDPDLDGNYADRDGYGGSGGGGSAADTTAINGKSGFSPGGEAGGNGSTSFKGGGGGGEGGAGATGANGGTGGAGENGILGGGGGGKSTGTAATASDGGGAGGVGATAPASGTANTGGGGGGAGNTTTDTAGGSGGSGKVIIKYLTV